MTNLEQQKQLVEVISDPYNGREEGVDFWVDEDGYIQAQDVRTAAMLMREANNSGQFSQRLVRVAQKGDSILLGFDNLIDQEPVFETKIGDINAQVKKDQLGKFCVYLDNKRSKRMFSKLASAKTFLKTLNLELKNQGTEPESFDD